MKIHTAAAQEFTFKRVPSPGSSSHHGVGVQDPQGYMWFGSSSGLIRYDGYKYTTYINNPLDTNSIAGNRIETIYAGRDGMIWIGLSEYGLDRFDPQKSIFTHFRHDPKNRASLSGDGVTAILEDKEGFIWVGTHSGLNRLDPVRHRVVRYRHNPADATTLSNDQVRAIYEDKQGTLWIGTGSAFLGNQRKEGGLNHMDRQNGTFKRYLHNSKNTASLIDNRVRAIYEDSRGTFWVGTAGDGLHTMNRANGTFERHQYNPSQPDALSRPPLKKVVPWAVDHITFITEDAARHIWIGTLGNGVNCYNPDTKRTRHFPDIKNDVSADEHITAWWALTSKDGVLWIGYWNGLFQVDPLQRNITYVATGSRVCGIYADSGLLWYGGYSTGLVQKNEKSGTERRFVHDPRNPFSLSNNNIHCLYKDSEGELWIGTHNGLNRFNVGKGTFTRYLAGPDNYSEWNKATVQGILEDRKGWLWAATGDGLIRMNRLTGAYTRYSHNPNDTNSLSSNALKRIYEDQSGNMWVGSYLGGLNRISVETAKVQRFLNGADIRSILEDSEGILWVGTSHGLYRSSPSKGSFSLFRDPDKEIPSNLVVEGLLEDNQKTIWINASVGILKLNLHRGTLLLYSKSQSLCMNGFYKAKNGTLYFGDWNGYYAFVPEQLKSNQRPPQIVVSEFRLADQRATEGKESLLTKPLSQTKQIRLRHDQNVFAFEFAGLHYSNPELNRHLFMLEGLDKAWRKAGEEKTAYYYNVPSGTYVFRIKAASSDGVWAEKSITVIINPPWWRTWWAYILYALLLIVAIRGIADYRSRHLQRELEQRKKEQQLSKLQRQKSELEMLVLRAQMNPHFIFNSLNSINRFILENNQDEASAYLTKFSRLMRLILQNSQEALITLESELATLQLYLELEALRFDNQFEFKITVDEAINPSVLKVPPLTIQPYAENAIWHGLMHKRSEGKLDVIVWVDDDLLCCSIKDDGIGRKKAAELKGNSKSAYKSVGMRITSDRIALMQHEKSIVTSVQINDLVLPNGSAGGTEVIIQLPLKYD